ncbi:phage major capsid protein [Rubellicoccus peritrichatus]|uniref:Phage major capsid protein n=1 Tax=Rubellicoccus peritrichatus TaxID=3080537 RepID=A0AAQ3L7D8_9BACT|nr:phage major capsid protein [Puniceicoccus sp. CR14]WOO40382.1 phage major capsid protein [Puniceicoccus sp. CR14]WOO40431.1 phage major capsid protein [Puniceicoccus sp. CR14]WOO40480.1 phage major capsid protein [Puniceicoccus sp. CR14]WOO40529.1 phage major capsid protein [Puniceicoccus sp. CR14]
MPEHLKQFPKQLTRALKIERVSVIDEEERTVELSFSSEEPIDDGFGYLDILDHGPGSVDLSRLLSNGPLLFNHQKDMHLGAVISAEVRDRKGYAVVRFGRGPLAEEKFQDVKDSILRSVSVTTDIDEVKRESTSTDEKDVFRVTKWTPVEVSLVTVPADTTVGVGRGKANQSGESIKILDNTMSEENKNETVTREKPASSPEVKTVVEVREDPKAIERAKKTEQNRVAEISRLAREYNVDNEVVRDYVENDKPLADFQGHILRDKLEAQAITTKPDVGMSKKEKKEYSLTRALRLAGEGKPVDGLEGEASEATAKALKREAQGFYVPADMESYDDTRIARALASQNRKISRDLSVGVSADGGHTVQTSVLGGSLIELLRNRTFVTSLGARSLSGLQGNIAIPSADGGATAYWLGENDAVTGSTQTFGSLALSPKRLAGNTAYSKMLLAQSSIDIEAFVRDDLMRVLAIAKDLACIAGTGADNQPTGIINTTGINTVTFGAATAPTWAKVVEFETAVATDNADVESMAYLTTPGVRGAWKTTPKDAGSGQFLWAGREVNGYPSFATNQVPANRVVFGNFSDLIVADWAGIDVIVDPYSLKKEGKVEIMVTILTDCGVRHPESFAVSTDAGNQ